MSGPVHVRAPPPASGPPAESPSAERTPGMRATAHRRTRLAITAVGGVVLAGTAVGLAAHAATVGCSVSYTVTSQWSGGFGANVSITNLGDPINGWTLTWSYSAGQQITQAWNTTAS